MSLPAEASPLIKVAQGIFDRSNSYAALPLNTLRPPSSNRNSPFAYNQDAFQRLRNRHPIHPPNFPVIHLMTTDEIAFGSYPRFRFNFD